MGWVTGNPLQARSGDAGRRILFFLLMVATALIYLRAFPGDFVWDDRTYFLDNDILPSLQPWQFARIFSGPTNYWGEFLPLRDYLYVLEYQIFGTSTLGYHVVSLLLYLATGLALYRLLLALYNQRRAERQDPAGAFSTPQGGPALAVTALFLLHPCHVESVAYISGQKDLLSALFTFLALRYLYEAHIQCRFFGRTAAFGVLYFYCSALSKLTAVSTVACVPLLWLWTQRVEPRHLLRALSFWIVASVPVLVWTLYALGFAESNAEFLAPSPTVGRILHSIRVLGAHTLQAVLPLPLNFGYPFEGSFSWDAGFLAGLGVLAAVAVTLVRCPRSMTTLGLCLYVVYLLPVLQLTPVVANAGIYDRYLCIAVLGIAIGLERAASFAVERRPNLRRPLLGTAAVLLATLGALSWSHIPRFASDVASLEHAYKTFPGWSRAAFDYADALVEAGDLDRASEVAETEPSFSTPPWVRDYFRGRILLERGDAAAAREVLTRASHITHAYGYYPFPDLPLARALVAQGQTEAARVLLEGVVHSQIHNPLGQQMAQQLLTEIDARRNDTR